METQQEESSLVQNDEETSVLVQEQEQVVLEQDSSSSSSAARQEALQLRQTGKTLHDEGHWEQAALLFQNASVLLEAHVDEDNEIVQEYATCRLHQALCRLKLQDYVECVEACTNVLDQKVPAPIRARALHRRARAKLGLQDTPGALEDARSAAFLGDKKAVALYGKLMRQDGGDSDSSLTDLFQSNNNNPFVSDSTSSSSASSALLESLLSKSGDSGGGNPIASMLGSGNNGGLAKSVLASLSKQVESQANQERACQYLQNTNTAQVQQLAAMAGVPLSQGHATKLVSFCHGVTPKGIQKSVVLTKRVWYVVSIVKRVLQLVKKYRMILILWFLLAWIKSALQRPIPINKKAARLAMKQAMKQGVV